MMCATWWVAALMLSAAAVIGFVACFLWHWWLISRPGARQRG
ncbi:MAG TPA: hypothetical protein VGL09_04770 [Methylomirabilota bacterium]|jgi:hypothetical protein